METISGAIMVDLRALPSVDQLLQTPQIIKLISSYGRPLTLSAIRYVLLKVRQESVQLVNIPPQEDLLSQIEKVLTSWTFVSLQPVINATGVILHTNLGRAPLSYASLQAIQMVSSGYCNLEYDLESGQRGSRLAHAEELLKRLLGVEAALVVNNNAAAVLLVLSVLAHRRGVLIARSQLVEIGGGFRVPDVMRQSGAKLIEVGTTNRVHLADYEQALLEQNPSLLLHTHRSNFRIIGFTAEPALNELAVLAHQAGIPLVDDIGSGALLDTSRYSLGHEPTVQESLEAGSDLVCFSGDKLLGGPQAGIIVGRADLVARLKKHPLARAIRADKLCLAALSTTLIHYLKDEAESEIPVWRMIAATPEQIQERAKQWQEFIGRGEVIAGESTVGGGSLPEEILSTFLLALQIEHPNRFLTHLRLANPPVIARLEDNQVLFDPRTVLPEQEAILLNIIKSTSY